MNREIKFRGWNGSCLYDNVIVDGDMWSLDLVADAWRSGPIMQYTGLKDKNGKDIYEGDILDLKHYLTSCEDDAISLRVVIDFHAGAFWFKGGGYTDCNWHFYNAEDRQIIGNIYENPELLNLAQ